MATAPTIPSPASLTPNFGAQANPLAKKPGLLNWLFGGDENPDQTAGDKVKAEAAAKAAQDKLNATAAKKAEGDRAKADSDGRRAFNNVSTGLLFDRVSDKGTHMTCSSAQLSEKQLQRLVLAGIGKGWGTFYAYKGDNFDGQTTQRAKGVYDKMKAGGLIPSDVNMNFAVDKMRGQMEPWRLDIPGRKAIEDWSDNRKFQTEARKTSRQAAREVS